MARPRKYKSNADRQRAYRLRIRNGTENYKAGDLHRMWECSPIEDYLECRRDCFQFFEKTYHEEIWESPEWFRLWDGVSDHDLLTGDGLKAAWKEFGKPATLVAFVTLFIEAANGTGERGGFVI